VVGTPLRVVLDTNTLLRGLISANSAAAKVRGGAEGRVFIPLLSKPVLDEYRAVLGSEAIVSRFPEITPELVEVTTRRLRFVSDYVRTPKVTFEYRRDPLDQKFIELAIALNATHLISADNDLLSLPSSHSEAGRRFRQRLPNLEVLAAGTFINKYAQILRLD